MARAWMLWGVLSLAAAWGQGAPGPGIDTNAAVPAGLPLEGAVWGVHDASMIKQGATWYVFGSGERRGAQLPVRCSEDLRVWRPCGAVFAAMPAWIPARLPGIGELWAPDISFSGGEYRLYYAYSLLGKNTSGIALATTRTLDRTSPDFGWVDRGIVLESRAGDDFNAIDPNYAEDAGGQGWLVYGSFWDGIKLRRLGADGKLDPADRKVYSLARRGGGLFGGPGYLDDAIEGAFVVRHEGLWYLFASWDHCCLGAASDYRVMVGRSASITGPYLDAVGKPLRKGGGTPVVAGDARWAGPGGESVWVADDGTDWLVYHAVDRASGRFRLQISRMAWVDGWPQARLPDESAANGDAAAGGTAPHEP